MPLNVINHDALKRKKALPSILKPQGPKHRKGLKNSGRKRDPELSLLYNFYLSGERAVRSRGEGEGGLGS